MKRIAALVCLMIMTLTIGASAVFADDEDSKDADSVSSGLEIVETNPEAGATNVSIENLSVKLTFNKDMVPESDKIQKSNASQFKLVDENGTDVPISIYYSDKENEQGLIMVLSDASRNDDEINSKTYYTLTVGGELQASDGSVLGSDQEITFRTQDQRRSTTVYMILMGAMIVGMIVFSVRSSRRSSAREAASKGKHDTVNPYKEAKRTGKSVEEIVEKDRKQKAKEAEMRAKREAAEAELEEKEAREAREKATHKRVSAPKPISESGSKYKVKVVTTQKPQQSQEKPKAQTQKKGTTNPKNQTGKQKNQKNSSSKNKKKKKKKK